MAITGGVLRKSLANQIRQIVDDAIHENFQQKRRWQILNWKWKSFSDYSPSYQEWLIRHNRHIGKRVLILTGQLFSSIRTTVQTATDEKIEIKASTNKVYAQKMNKLAPFMTILDEDKDDIRELTKLEVRDFIISEIKRGISG